MKRINEADYKKEIIRVLKNKKTEIINAEMNFNCGGLYSQEIEINMKLFIKN